MSDSNKYNPVAFDPKAYAAHKSSIDPEFKIAYDALEDEFAALRAFLHARTQAGLTQAEVASRMGVSQPVLAHIEASLGKQDHSPSLNTLRRYANACGMKLVIQMVLPNTPSHREIFSIAQLPFSTPLVVKYFSLLILSANNLSLHNERPACSMTKIQNYQLFDCLVKRLYDPRDYETITCYSNNSYKNPLHTSSCNFSFPLYFTRNHRGVAMLVAVGMPVT